MSVRVRYSDIAIGAKQAFDYETNENTLVYNPDLMKEEGAIFSRYDLPLEINSFILDGGAEFLPESSSEKAGLISEYISNENGSFENGYPFIRLSAIEKYSSVGLTVRFDESKYIYATDMHIEWYRENELIESDDFYPDEPMYFCSKKVDYFDKVEITVKSINLPHTRFRINTVDFGLVVDFAGNELRSAKIIQEINPISTSVPVNPFDFTIDSQRGLEFSFQEHQPINLFFNDRLLSTTFVRSSTRQSKNIWSVKTEDYIWMMDTVSFNGGIYNDKNAVELLSEIFSIAKVPYEIESIFSNKTVSGYIPYTTCRNALMQVCFAIQAVADTSGRDVVGVFSLSDDVVQKVPKERIMQGQNFKGETRVTSVEVVSHSYVESEEITVVYSAEKSGVGEGIFVSFSEPLHDLSITGGVINEYGVNYAIIDANDYYCTLSGKKYNHTKVVKSKKNPLVLTTDSENVITIENATLVSSGNIDNILETCYNYFVNTNSANMSIIDGRGENPDGSVYFDQPTTVGDFIEYETEYLGEKSGRITKQSYSLVGGILVKDSVVR